MHDSAFDDFTRMNAETNGCAQLYFRFVFLSQLIVRQAVAANATVSVYALYNLRTHEDAPKADF